MNGEAALPLTLRGEGEAVQVVSDGVPATVRVTVPLKPFEPAIWRLYVAV